MGKNKKVKKLERKHTTLKVKHKLLKQITKASLRLLKEVEKGPKPRIGESIISRMDKDKLNLHNDVVQDAMNEAAPENLTMHIVIPPKELWISELLESANRTGGDAVLKYFTKQINAKGIQTGELISAKPDGDPIEGKWIVTYLPKKSDNPTIHTETHSIPISS